MHILSPETDNCPSWISGRERMTVENKYFTIYLHERMLPTSAGVEPTTFWSPVRTEPPRSARRSILISWLLKKPTDLDLHCLKRQGISAISRTRVNVSYFISTYYGNCPKSLYTNLSEKMAYANTQCAYRSDCPWRMMMLIWCFKSLSTLFKSYQGDGW